MQKDKFAPKYTVWTLWLILGLCLCFAFAALTLHNREKDACYENVERIAQQAAYNLQYTMEINRFQLEIIADMLPEDLENERQSIGSMLDLLCRERLIAALCVQLPDSSVIQGTESPMPEFGGLHRFDHDAEKAPYISDICRAGEEGYVYQAIPIRRNGRVAGVLYGFFNLRDFPSFFSTITDYDGQTYLYLVEGTSGDFMMDTWPSHGGVLGNLNTMGERETKPGYSQETMRAEIRGGGSGYFVFKSKSTGSWLYTYYRPAGINNWSVQVTVEESLLLAEVRQTDGILAMLASVVFLLIVVYVVWVFYKQTLLSRKNSRQLEHSDNMYQVQQILFDAYEKPEQIGRSLEKTAQFYEAEGAALLTLKGNFVHHSYNWVGAEISLPMDIQGRNVLRDFPELYRQLGAGQNVCYPGTELPAAEAAILHGRNIRNLLAVPMRNSEGNLQSVLFVLNSAQKQAGTEFLVSISADFMRALQGMDSYRVLHNMGRMDSLTGLKNRNVFDASLAGYAHAQCHLLYSIYIDVNGLHEVNNLYGHSAGDTMLRAVAGQIRGAFGDEHTYRIGGDEFAVFAMDMDEERLQQKVQSLKEAVRENDYYISVGYAVQKSDCLNIDELLAAAEEQMYQDKQQFYQTHTAQKSPRDKNVRLEKLIQEKQDMDSFLELISSYYTGICVIDLDKDVARVLYDPGYFADILRKYNYRCLKSIREYAEQYICPEDRQAFLTFCDYQQILSQLRQGNRPRILYRKTDGSRMLIRLYPSRNYPKVPEIFWFFERQPEN